MPKKWLIKSAVSEDIIAQLLSNRGLKTTKEIENFLNPTLQDYEKELNLPGITTAQKRIEQAIKKEELIIIYGDYDADGLCGTAVLFHGLVKLGAKVLPYIPHREKEGYGLSKEGLKSVKEKGAKLVITVDNGIVAIEQAKFAKSLGLDLIITDHHLPQNNLPPSLAIVHSTEICGAAVAWCLIRKMIDEKSSLKLLDLVAIATICDLLPLVGINRMLVKLGLEQLNSTDKVGLQALILEAGLIRGSITAYHVGHILGPRINAIGRLEHSIDALRLLCTKDAIKARSLALHLCEINDQKKKLTVDSIVNVKELILQDTSVLNKKVLIFASEKWIPGVVGLMAGRLSEEYKLPAIVIAKGETLSKGSARSVNGLNIVETLRKCANLLIDVGGHPAAAGFTIESSKIEIFKTTLEKLVEYEPLSGEDTLEIEALVPVKKLTNKLITELNQFEPTGLSNPRPILASENVQISRLKTVGSGQHLKFNVEGVDCIAFSLGSLINMLQEGQLVNLAYYLELDEFNGRREPLLKILDIQINN